MHFFLVIICEHTKQEDLDTCGISWRYATISMKSLTESYILYHLTKKVLVVTSVLVYVA